MKRCIFKMVGMVFIMLAVVGIGLFSHTMQAQEQSQEQTPEKPGNIQDLENRVKAMQAAINDAAQKLEIANRPPDERIKELEELIGVAQDALNNLSEGGDLFEALATAIKTTEDKKKEWNDKANDPKISAKVRVNYDRLKVRFEKLAEELFDKQILINQQRDELGKHIKEWGDQKMYIADLILADDLAMANEALLDVLNSVKDVNESFNEFAGKFTGEPQEETEQQHN